MKNKSIFTRQNQTLINLFRDAKHPDKVLCVPIDYAKQTHMALFCNGSERLLKKPFPVKNNPEGIAFLLEAVEKICRKHHIKREHVFFGGEDCGTFSDNFIYALREEGFAVMGVNAADAAKQRDNLQASTDKLDLLGIAKMLLGKRGSIAGGQIGKERALRSLTRHRDSQVRMRTATGNRIHKIVEQLFPGFLDKECSAIPPFSEASLYLMEDRFSPVQIAKRQDKALLRKLKMHGLQHPEAAVGKLKADARQVLGHPPKLVGMLQTSLAGEVNLYRCLCDNIGLIGREIAQQLAQTPGAMLTTIRGTGITLAAGVTSEVGPSDSQPSTRRLCSYAGIVPRVKQTGGPEKGAKTGKVSRRNNHLLKNYIVQCGNHLGQHGPADLKEDHRRREANGQHADFGMARRYLRMGMRLMKNNESYIPPELRSLKNDAALQELRSYYLDFWPKLLDKWVKVGAVHTAFAPENPLGQWHKRIEVIYEIELPLPKKK
jgi:transposase